MWCAGSGGGALGAGAGVGGGDVLLCRCMGGTMNLDMVVARIIDVVLDTYGDNLSTREDETIVVESRWKADMEKAVRRIIKEEIVEAAKAL
jgi:hypothetical protein